MSLVSIPEAAKTCGVSTQTIHYWTRTGKLGIVQNFHGNAPRWLVPLDRARDLAADYQARQARLKLRAAENPTERKTETRTSEEPELDYPSACDEVADSLDSTDLLTASDRVELARRNALLEVRRCAA